MPKKGEKGMPQADKDAATAELKQACELFAAELAKRQDESPDRKLLEKHFTQKQLQSLWKRLEAKRGVAPQNVKEAWDALKEYGSEGRQAKWAALGDFALAKMEGVNWAENMITFTRTVSKTKELKKKKKTFYPGELRNKHGATEAAALIAAGTYRETKDEHGMLCYEFVKKTEILSKKGRSELRAKQSYPRGYAHG
jgi:hypothetical protein